jgi:glycosyltransferase involved in cell wall biosynthesis
MRIGVDFHAAEREGTGNCTYIRNLVESLIALDASIEYVLYVVDPGHPYYRTFAGMKHVRIHPVPHRSPFVRFPRLGLATFRDHIDVLHATYYGPPVHCGKLLLTVHDLAYLRCPETFGRFDRIKDRLLVPLFIKKAGCVMTVSHYSRRDIIETYKASPEHVAVIYNGVQPRFKPLAPGRKPGPILKEYAVEQPYILYAGRLNKRKNITGLMRAFTILKRKNSLPHRLVIVGKRDVLPPEDVREILSSPFIQDIVFTGFVPDEHLPLLYGAADVFVYPSLFEGFGLPCLEAMACGCPVVASKATSIPEVVGDAGILVDPLLDEAIAEAIERVIFNDACRRHMIEMGIDRARRFTWHNAARSMLELCTTLTNN